MRDREHRAGLRELRDQQHDTLRRGAADLGDDGDALNNDQPQLIIDPEFWPEFMRNGFNQCVHREQCASTRCLGLNTAYVRKHGWHADLLVPLARN